MASIGHNYEFDAEAVAQGLRDAMEGMGTDENSVASYLGGNDNEQLQEVRTQYTAMFGRDLVDDLKGETGGHFEELCVALVRERMEFFAYMINDALSGAGTSEQVLVDFFGTINPFEVQLIAQIYEEKFEKKMEEDITSDVHGFFEKFLIAIMSGGRSAEDPDYDLAMEDADKLYNAGEGTFGTDESAFMSILMTRSNLHLRAVFEAYEGMRESDDDKTLLGAIQSEFTGNEEKLLCTIVKYSLGTTDYFVDLLRECVEGVGTSERRLINTIVGRAEIDLAEIACAYNDKFEEDLAERIKSEVGSDLGNLLSLLVTGNQ